MGDLLSLNFGLPSRAYRRASVQVYGHHTPVRSAGSPASGRDEAFLNFFSQGKIWRKRTYRGRYGEPKGEGCYSSGYIGEESLGEKGDIAPVKEITINGATMENQRSL